MTKVFQSPLRHNEQGQGLVEYALILVLVAIVVIVVLSLLGTSIGGVFCGVQGALNNGYFHCGQCEAVNYEGNISANGAQDFRMDLKAGDHVTIFTQAASGFDPTITLLDASGTQIGFDDDSGGNLSARLTYTAGANATYTFRIKEYAHRAGSFTGYTRCS